MGSVMNMQQLPLHGEEGPAMPLDWMALQGTLPPPREWAVEQWWGMGHCTVLAGKGATGKSLISQQLGTAVATGHEWFAPIPQRRVVLAWFGEDDENELWRRQINVNAAMGIAMPELAGAFIAYSYDGKDIQLAGKTREGRLRPTARLRELAEQVSDYRADAVILDSVARIFGGNENDRHEVTTFLSLVTGALRERQPAVLLLAHPSRAQGAEYSGSSAWENSARSRWLLSTTPPDKAGQCTDDEGSDGSVRYLSRRKANYAAADTLRLVYSPLAGVFVPEGKPGAAVFDAAHAEDVVMRGFRELWAQGQRPTEAATGGRGLVSLLIKHEFNSGLSRAALETGMRSLMNQRRLVIREVGRYSNRNPKMGVVEAGT